MVASLMKSILADRPEKAFTNLKELVATIEYGYVAKQGPSFKTKKSFSPSTLVYNHGECARYWCLAFDGADFQETVTPYDVANMRNGSLSHERIQEAMENSGILVSKEKKLICNDPPIFGFCDAELMIDGEVVPAEIKTTKSETFQYRKDAGKPAYYHVGQLLIYLKLLDKKRGVLIYENKNDYELLIMPLEMTEAREKWLEDSFEWMRTVRKSWEDRQLPIKNYRSNSKICKKCPLLETCNNAPKGTVKIPALEKPE